MKKLFLTLLVAVACTVTLHAAKVGDIVGGSGLYKITSINPNEVQLLEASADDRSNYFTETLDGQTYDITFVAVSAFAEGRAGVLPAILRFDRLKSLDGQAFRSMRKWKKTLEVDLRGSSLTTIPTHCFIDAQVTRIYLPNTVTTIVQSAFGNCTLLNTIDLSYIQSIGAGAFGNCTSLKNVSLPQCLTSVGEGAFSNCKLASLTMYNTTSTFGSQGEMMASNGVVTMHIVDWSNKNVLGNHTGVPMTINYIYNNAPVTGNYTIPSTVTTLGQGALYHAAGLTGITLPASLTSIGQHAFGKCTTLTSITSNATTAPAVANANAFAEVNKSIPVTIPDNIETYYSYRHATGWKDFTNYQVSLSTVKGEAILELNDAIGSHSEQSIQDVLEGYTAWINDASSKTEVESICTEAIPVLALAVSKLDCIAAVKTAAVGVVADNLQALVDGYVTRINAATTIQAAEKVRDEAKAAFKLMKDKQPMIDALESKKEGVHSEAVLKQIQSYIDYITNPKTTLAQATTKYNEVMPILEYILEGYKEGEKVGKAEGAAEAYSAPTEPGMRLKVTKTDGKVYEFLVTDVESTKYYRATE